MDSGARSKFTTCLKTWWDTFIQQGSMQGRTQDLELGGGGGGGRKGQRVGIGGGCVRGRRPLPLQLGGMGERCKLPHWGLGRSPRSFASSAL